MARATGPCDNRARHPRGTLVNNPSLPHGAAQPSPVGMTLSEKDRMAAVNRWNNLPANIEAEEAASRQRGRQAAVERKALEASGIKLESPRIQYQIEESFKETRVNQDGSQERLSKSMQQCILASQSSQSSPEKPAPESKVKKNSDENNDLQPEYNVVPVLKDISRQKNVSPYEPNSWKYLKPDNIKQTAGIASLSSGVTAGRLTTIAGNGQGNVGPHISPSPPTVVAKPVDKAGMMASPGTALTAPVSKTKRLLQNILDRAEVASQCKAQRDGEPNLETVATPTDKQEIQQRSVKSLVRSSTACMQNLDEDGATGTKLRVIVVRIPEVIPYMEIPFGAWKGRNMGDMIQV
jgi:hypothetical protein